MNPSDPSKATTRRPVDLATESVAGEEDPGATFDLASSQVRAGARAQAGASASDQGQGQGGDQGPNQGQSAPRAKPAMSPGDEAPAGTPGTGEGVCPRCGGSGRLEGGSCPDCAGTGKVTVGIGGA
ncbi:hypothetical protein WG922_08070 [Ramlibacter sp. AN1015]|uniref:hypothetical protein n=1 Tax=Ramlibacter sp. AN1015 TaxID=3133428 RepID=UPI0030C5EDB3